MSFIFPIIILGLVLGGYFYYMKVYYPKFKEQYTAAHDEFESEWTQDKEKIVNEYFSNPNKFGLMSEITKGENIVGVISAKLPESFKSQAKEAIVGAITFTSKADMSLYYLVATDKGLHYTVFDGEKCILNEVFDYDNIEQETINENTFSFVYKGEKFPFKKALLPAGYPRFNVHERSKTPTSNDRSVNYFVREFLAYETTNNAEYKQSNDAIPKLNLDAMKVSKEQLKDTKVREYLSEEFRKKLVA
ncbi:hypothetical protein WAF17_08585 [Bernardetia sp. ABR2-2B]|uniref:hypothetical protein n=1 Tax=Bernardetia sp. ABR2-2B TaxID=3127472 RepID=UPI0030D00FC3